MCAIKIYIFTYIVKIRPEVCLKVYMTLWRHYKNWIRTFLKRFEHCFWIYLMFIQHRIVTSSYDIKINALSGECIKNQLWEESLGRPCYDCLIYMGWNFNRVYLHLIEIKLKMLWLRCKLYIEKSISDSHLAQYSQTLYAYCKK